MMARNRGLSRFVRRSGSGLSGRRGLGQSGEVEVEGSGLPSGTISDTSGELPSYLPDITTGLSPTPASILSTAPSSSSSFNLNQFLSSLAGAGAKIGQTATLPAGYSLTAGGAIVPSSLLGGSLNISSLLLYGGLAFVLVMLVSSAGKR